MLFAVLCFVWGTTWLAMKVGITTMPPEVFAGTRWTVAGLVLLTVRRLQGHSLKVPFRLRGRLLLCGVLMACLNPVIQLYGLRYVSAGLASVLSCALTPISLLGFAIAFRQERLGWRQGAAVAVGVAGIFVLFGPKAMAGELGWTEVLGALGVIVGTLAYCAGSVLARPLMRTIPPADVSAMVNFIGGGVLLLGALLVEPQTAMHQIVHGWTWPVFAAWLYLLLPGSLGATIIYFLLVRDWGASRAGTYAFISPIIAVILGAWLFGEHVDVGDVTGMALMLVAAGMVLRLRT
jgi:drug/metabolite transporter (DMT)-like permease